MEKMILLQASDLVTRLAAGIAKEISEAPAADAVDENAVELQAPLLTELPLDFWGLMILAILGGVAWVLWFRLRRGRVVEGRVWPNLVQFLQNGRNRPKAMKELSEIDVLLSLVFTSNEGIEQDWLRLTSSEKSVARSILEEKPANEIAEEMAVTVSHVYNIRSSIRRKWGVESNQELVAAIQRRIPS